MYTKFNKAKQSYAEYIILVFSLWMETKVLQVAKCMFCLCCMISLWREKFNLYTGTKYTGPENKGTLVYTLCMHPHNLIILFCTKANPMKLLYNILKTRTYTSLRCNTTLQKKNWELFCPFVLWFCVFLSFCSFALLPFCPFVFLSFCPFELLSCCPVGLLSFCAFVLYPFFLFFVVLLFSYPFVLLYTIHYTLYTIHYTL